MNHIEEFESIKLEIQTVKFDADKVLLEKIREMIRYLKRFSSNRILYATVFLEDKQGKLSEQKSVKVLLGVAGPDIVASERGDDFGNLLNNVREKLIVQLKK